MKNNNRTKNVMLNVIFGYIAQIGIFILSFVGRRIFLKYLSADYLGINGLYSNILTILSLAELGLDAAVVYSLYKPVAQNDKTLIRSLLVYFKKIYYFLAFAIFALGLCIIPFLPIIINSNLENFKLVIYYLVFLCNTVASYFVAPKVALLSAYQQQRVYKVISLFSSFLLQLIYIIVLVTTKNYLIYIISMLTVTIISNIILTITCNKLYKDILVEGEMVVIDKNPIIERVKATFLYKIGAVLINSTDNILISTLISTNAVGFYSNYYTVVNAVQSFIAIITSSLISGIGNYAVTNKRNDQVELFYSMLLFYNVIASIGFIGFCLLFNDFISIWLGNDFLFSNDIVFVISLNFYLTTAITPVWMFREANGLFNQVKYLLFIRAILNILLSIVLGKIYGIFGIFLATAISLVLTNFWYEPRLMFSSFYDIKTSNYWKKQGKNFLSMILSFVVCYLLICNLKNSFLFFALKVGIVVIVTSLVFAVFNLKTEELKKLKRCMKFN